MRAEAAALGYAELFEGRVYGAVGDVAKEAKRARMIRAGADVVVPDYSQLGALLPLLGLAG